MVPSALGFGDLKAVRRVVRKPNKSTSSIFKSHELNLTLIDGDLSWVNYCNKHPVLNKIILNDLNSYSRAKALGGVAKNLYETDRWTFINTGGIALKEANR